MAAMSVTSSPESATGWASWIPAFGWLRSYQRTWLRDDVVAGLTAAAVVVPQAMAYGAIAGLPLVVGLYTALVPLMVYAVMGTSRPLSVTTTSTIAILTASALHQVAPNGSNEALVAAAATLAFLVGGILLLASVLRMGIVANFISEPVLIGFKAGVGLTIVVDQIPKMLGVHFPKGHFFYNLLSIMNHLPQASVATIVLALAMLTLQLGLQRFLPRVPAALVTVAGGIALSGLAGLNRFDIELVGDVKGGLPSFALPELSLLDPLWPAAIGIGLMSFVETIAAGQVFRGVDEPQPEANKELAAIGLTNLFGACYSNFPSGGGTSQTAVNRRAGAHSQLAGLVTATVVAAVLFFLAPLVALMPQATLAVVVIVPCAAMINLPEFRAVWMTRFMEFTWAVASVAGVVLLGTLRGILVAVILSLFALIIHGNRWPVFVLGRKPGTDVFRPRSEEHPEDETFPGLLLLKAEGMIYFFNVQRMFDLMSHLISEQRPRIVVLDCSAIPDLEYTALKRLIEGENMLQQSGITLWLAGLNPEPLELVQKSALGKILGRSRMYFNLEQAVESYQKQFGDRK
jgi:high affinity sulfate transporter 1